MAGSGSEPVNAQGRSNKLSQVGKKLGGNALNHGFIGLDTYMRVKSGESAPVALGKAVLTNAAFSMLPGGIVTGMAVMGAMAAPEVMNALDQAAGNLNTKKQQFGGNFQESDIQMRMMQQGIGKMQDARMHATRRMANHARGAQKVY